MARARTGYTISRDGRTSCCGHLHIREDLARQCAAAHGGGRVMRASRKEGRPIRILFPEPEIPEWKTDGFRREMGQTLKPDLTEVRA